MKFGANRLNRTTQCSDNHKTDALLIGSFNELQRRGFDVAHLPQDVRQSSGQFQSDLAAGGTSHR